MSETTYETSLYDTLEVPETATQDEIQQAYFRLVRLCPPQRDPERYQALNEARNTLLDPQRRSEYDQTRKSGPRVRVLVDQAALAIDRDPQKALSLLKSAVMLAPDLPRPRLLLTQLLMRNRDYVLAERQYQWLLRRTPNDEALRCKLARCYLFQQKPAEAEAELKRVLELNEAHYDAQLLLARIYRSQGRTRELIEALEEAIFMDQEEDFSDFNALLQLLMVYIQNEDEKNATLTAHRLLDVIPADKVGIAADAFIRTAELFLNEEYYVWTRQLLLHLQELPLADEDPRRVRFGELIHKSEIQQEIVRLSKDLLCVGPIQQCFLTLYQDKSSDNIRQSRMSSALERIQRETEALPRQVLQQLAYIRREYPLISVEQDAFLGTLCQRALHCQTVAEMQPLTRPTHMPSTSPAPVAKEPRRGGLFGRILSAR